MPRDYKLTVINNVTCLIDIDNKQKPIYIDFLKYKSSDRIKKASKKTEKLLKAVGNNSTIIDATAGFAQDSFLLAHYGFKVHMLEQSNIVSSLILDAMARGLKTPCVSDIIKNNLKFTNINSIEYLKTLKTEEYPDVIYLDPMFNELNKKSLPNKNMYALRQIIDSNLDKNILLETALEKAKNRVVIKNSIKYPFFSSNKKINFSLLGKSCRFDVYIC